MLTAMLGENSDIFFPKLAEESMTTFDAIARDLLKYYGYEIDECGSDEEAIEKSWKQKDGVPYPVYFSPSDTSGEKTFEEFYAEDESVDMERFSSLGVITDKPDPEKSRVAHLIEALEDALKQQDCGKTEIMKIISAYLPNFSYIETGKSLDEKV